MRTFFASLASILQIGKNKYSPRPILNYLKEKTKLYAILMSYQLVMYCLLCRFTILVICLCTAALKKCYLPLCEMSRNYYLFIYLSSHVSVIWFLNLLNAFFGILAIIIYILFTLHIYTIILLYIILLTQYTLIYLHNILLLTFTFIYGDLSHKNTMHKYYNNCTNISESKKSNTSNKTHKIQINLRSISPTCLQYIFDSND